MVNVCFTSVNIYSATVNVHLPTVNIKYIRISLKLCLPGLFLRIGTIILHNSPATNKMEGEQPNGNSPSIYFNTRQISTDDLCNYIGTTCILCRLSLTGQCYRSRSTGRNGNLPFPTVSFICPITLNKTCG